MEYYEKLHPLRSLIIDAVNSHFGYLCSIITDALLTQRISTMKELQVKLLPQMNNDALKQGISHLIGANLVVFLSVPVVKNNNILYENIQSDSEDQNQQQLTKVTEKHIDGSLTEGKFVQTRAVRTVLYSFNVQAGLGLIFGPLLQALVINTPLNEFTKILYTEEIKEEKEEEESEIKKQADKYYQLLNNKKSEKKKIILVRKEQIENVFNYIITKGMATVPEIVKNLSTNNTNTEVKDNKSDTNYKTLIRDQVFPEEIKNIITSMLGLNFIEDFRATQCAIRHAMLAIYIANICNSACNVQITNSQGTSLNTNQPVQKKTFRDVLAEELNEMVSLEIDGYLHVKMKDGLIESTNEDNSLKYIFFTPNFSFLIGSVIAGYISHSYSLRLKSTTNGEKVLSAFFNLSGAIPVLGSFPHLGIETNSTIRPVSMNDLLKCLDITQENLENNIIDPAIDEAVLTKTKVEYVVAILSSLGVIAIAKSDPNNVSWTISAKLLKEQNKFAIIDRMIGERHGPAAMRIISLLRENSYMDVPKICELVLLPKDQALAILEKLHAEKFIALVQIPKTVDMNPEMSIYVYGSNTNMCISAAKIVTSKMLQAIRLRYIETQKKYETSRSTGVERTKTLEYEKQVALLEPVLAKVLEMVLPILF